VLTLAWPSHFWTLGSTGSVTSIADTPRRSNVISLAGNTWAVHGWDWRGFGSSTGDYDLAGKIAFSAWVKSSADGEFIVNIQTNAGLRGLWYYSNGTHGTTPYWVSGSGANERACFPSNIGRDGVWRRIERNLQQDITAAWPGETLVAVRGLTLAAYTSSPLLVDDLRFSNSMTTEHVVLAPGAVGHIARQRATNPGTYAHTDRYFHYDQVGSVLCETDSAGALAQTHHQDAFGNTLASWSTGYLDGDKTGFHHNTKEYDANVEMVYMYQRWYSAELGVFASRAPMPRSVEHPYTFGLQSPNMHVDPDGRIVIWNPYTWGDLWVNGSHFVTGGTGAAGGFVGGAAAGIGSGEAAVSMVGFSSGVTNFVSLGVIGPFHDPCDELQAMGADVGLGTGVGLGIASLGASVGEGLILLTRTAIHNGHKGVLALNSWVRTGIASTVGADASTIRGGLGVGKALLKTAEADGGITSTATGLTAFSTMTGEAGAAALGAHLSISSNEGGGCP